MYIPASFQEPRLEAMHELIRTHPLGLLITAGPAGLQASPVPFLLDTTSGPNGTLQAHLARANPHWRELLEIDDCLIVFQGEQGYITPSWYPSKSENHKVVPTWNYATVQVHGKPGVIEDGAWLRHQLGRLTAAQEVRRNTPWAIGDAPEDYLASQLKAIVGIEIPIARIEGKWKMSQNKGQADREGVIQGLRAPDDPHHHPLLADQVVSRARS